MITILHDLIADALSKGYQRECMRIQISERFYEYLVDMDQLVKVTFEEEDVRRMTMMQTIMMQFMGINVDRTTSYFMGEGFMLVYDMKSINNEIRPMETKMLGIYSTSLGLPIK